LCILLVGSGSSFWDNIGKFIFIYIEEIYYGSS
jgi:hypothetical protein